MTSNTEINKIHSDLKKIIDIAETKEDIIEHVNLYFELKELNAHTREILCRSI